jgi:hypothetical protein
MHMYVHTHMYVCTHIHMHMYVCTHIHIHMYACTHIFSSLLTSTSVRLSLLRAHLPCPSSVAARRSTKDESQVLARGHCSPCQRYLSALPHAHACRGETQDCNTQAHAERRARGRRPCTDSDRQDRQAGRQAGTHDTQTRESNATLESCDSNSVYTVFQSKSMRDLVS